MPADPELIFYDGDCGLCHATVKFVLKRDANGSRFRYSPLSGQTIRHTLDDERRRALPDSIVVLTRDGGILTRSAAVLHILDRLDGPWPTIARVLGWLPRSLTDAGYRLVATIRRRLFARPTDVCPVVSPDLRKRFLS